MAVYADNFTRPDTASGLGSIPEGGPAWTVVAGSWRISDGRATSDSDPASDPVAGIEAAFDAGVTAALGSGGGDCAYLRVTGPDDWVRVRRRHYTTTQSYTTSTYVDPVYGTQWRYFYDYGAQVGGERNGQPVNDGHGHLDADYEVTTTHACPAASSYSHSHGVYSAAVDFTFVVRHSHNRIACYVTDTDRYLVEEGHYENETNFYTAHHHELILEKSVAGAVTELGSSSSQAERVRLSGDGGTVTVHDGATLLLSSSDVPADDGATCYAGIGLGASERYGSDLSAVTINDGNSAPFAPTAASPVGGASINPSQPLTFSWSALSDPDPGDAQSAYRLLVLDAADSSVVYDTGWVTSTALSRTAPPGTFVAGVDYSWTVAQRDSAAAESAASPDVFFSATPPPDAPTITSPTDGATIGTETALVTWSATGQGAFQVRTVADSGGVADTSTVYTDTGTVTGAARSTVAAFAVDGRYEHVQVRVQTSGLWSSWASVRVLVSYTPPATPIVVDDVVLDDAGREVALRAIIINPPPSGTQPAVTSNDLLRHELRIGGAFAPAIRRAVGLAPDGQFDDYHVAHLTGYEYAAVAHATNGTTSTSGWSQPVTDTNIDDAYAAGYAGGY